MKMREKKNLRVQKKMITKARPKLILMNPKTGEIRELKPTFSKAICYINDEYTSGELNWEKVFEWNDKEHAKKIVDWSKELDGNLGDVFKNMEAKLRKEKVKEELKIKYLTAVITVVLCLAIYIATK